MTKWKAFVSLIWPVIVCLFLAGCVDDNGPGDPKYSISADLNSVDFLSEVQSQDSNLTQDIVISYEGPGLLVGYADSPDPVSWLRFEVIRLTSGRARVRLSVIEPERIAPGQYDTTIRISTGDSDSNFFAHTDVAVSLKIYQFLVFGEPSFGAVLGTTEFEPQPIQLFGNTLDWTASADADWINLDVNTGQGTAVINVTPNVSELTNWGAYTGNVTIVDNFSGLEQVVAVELALDSKRLYSSSETIALSDLPHRQQLSRKVTVNTNALEMAAWQSSSNQPWLTTTNDLVNNTLTMTADTSNLPEGVSLAEVTIAPVDSNEAESDVVTVSVVKATDSDDLTLTGITSNTNAIVAHPYQPIIYVGEKTSIVAYDTYTGIELSRVDDLLAEVTDFIIADDGTTLYANAQIDEVIPPTEDDGEEEIITHNHVVKLSLADFSFETFELGDDVFTSPSKFLRFNDNGVLTNGLFEFFDPNNLDRLSWHPIVSDNQALFMITMDQANATEGVLATTTTNIYRAQGSFNRFKSQPIEFDETLNDIYVDERPIFNLRVRDDESELITNGTSNESYLFDGLVFTPNGLLSTDDTLIYLDHELNNVGQPMFMRFDPTVGFKLYLHDTDDSLISESLLPITQTQGFLLSGDQQRIVMQKPAVVDDAGDVTTEGDIIITNSIPEPQPLAFSGVFGDADLGTQSIELMGNARSWALAVNEPWLEIDVNAGTGPATITTSIDTSLLANPGKLENGVYLTDTNTLVRNRYPIELALDARRIYAADQAVALASTPIDSNLSQTVTVLTNGESLVAWQASTNASWLTLAQTGSELTVTADPSSLPDGLSITTVDVLPNDSAIAEGSSIAVSFYKHSAAVNDIDLNAISANSNGIIADPLRPLIYVANGTNLDSYHLYTGNKTVIANDLVGELRSLMIADDGSMLYGVASVEVDGIDTEQLVSVDLTNFATSTVMLDEDLAISPSFFVRISGLPLLANGVIQYVDPSDGSMLATNQLVGNFVQQLMQSRGSDTIFAASNTDLMTLSSSYNPLKSTDSTITEIASSLSFSDNQLNGVLVSSQDDIVYSIGTLNEYFAFDGTEFSEQGKLTAPSDSIALAAALGNDDHALFLRFIPSEGKFYLFRYNPDVSLHSQLEISVPTRQTPMSMWLSADDHRVAVRSGENIHLRSSR